MQISASRHDVVRRVSDGFRLARREIYVDQTRLQMANIGVFL